MPKVKIEIDVRPHLANEEIGVQVETIDGNVDFTLPFVEIIKMVSQSVIESTIHNHPSLSDAVSHISTTIER